MKEVKLSVCGLDRSAQAAAVRELIGLGWCAVVDGTGLLAAFPSKVLAKGYAAGCFEDLDGVFLVVEG